MIRSKKIKQFNKRFAEGEQYLTINHLGDIEETPKAYFWEQRWTFNHILPIIEMIKHEYPNVSENLLYGKTGLVARLIPIQVAYNYVKNRTYETFAKQTFDCVCVEDGSVDIDALETDHLSPGKIVVYRSGANQPNLLSKNYSVAELQTEEKNLLEEFKKITDAFIENVLSEKA